MDVRAIIVLGASNSSAHTTTEYLAGAPIAFTDVLGKPVVFRVVDNLNASGISFISVITDAATKEWPTGSAIHGSWTQAALGQLWHSVEQTFTEQVQSGAELILLVRLGAYADVNYSDLLEFHTKGPEPITCVVDEAGHSVDTYVFDASKRNHAAYFFRHQLSKSRAACGTYIHSGYCNPLATPGDLRNLAIDALMQRVQIQPEGEELKPGVWVGRGAHIHRRARVLSPAYIGPASRVRAAAVVTRCCALEHHSVVDCGTVVENVTALPHTYLGAGLDVTHSVVGHSRLWSLRRNVEVEFSDPRLIGESRANAPLRTLGSLMSLASFLPAQLLRGIFAPSHREDSPSVPEAIRAPAAALETPATNAKSPAPSVDAGEFPANLVIARRYGNQ